MIGLLDLRMLTTELENAEAAKGVKDSFNVVEIVPEILVTGSVDGHVLETRRFQPLSSFGARS